MTASLHSDKPVPRRPASPPPPLLPPRPLRPALARDDPQLQLASQFLRRTIPIEADESDLPPSYEASTLPRPSDAHVHITVRSSSQPASSSTASLPSLMAGRRSSINTQGYLLTAPMSHEHDRDGDARWSDRWDAAERSGCIGSRAQGFCFSRRGGCLFSDRDGCCFSDRGGCCFSDREGCCCSDTGGCCFSNDDGAFCSDGGGCCCARFEDERAPVEVETTMQNNMRWA